MAFSSQQIAQSFGAQTSMFAAQNAYAQQLAYPLQASVNPNAPPPPSVGAMMPPPPSLTSQAMGLTSGTVHPGTFGESLAANMASLGSNVGVPVAMGGLAIAGSMGTLGAAGRLLDPFSAGFSGFGVGRTLGGAGLRGIGMGAMGAGLFALPAMAVAAGVDAYAGAGMRGVQNQIGVNNMLRDNFNFVGGQGFMNRGFGTQQMGQIGEMLWNEARSNIFTNMGELNQIVAGGAQSGMFAGVRDVQEFGNKFRQLLDTLKTVQKELGGTLTEALKFAQEAKSVGIFRHADIAQFSTDIRTAMQTSGLSQEQLMHTAGQGAALARAVGGTGRQGAMGALRNTSTLAAAVNSGAIDQELLSEATGGLTGSAAVSAFVGSMMQKTARFTRMGRGRYSIFGLSNEDGTGLDAAQVARFSSGEMGVNELRRSAHRNVSGMGMAHARNMEGELRGAFLEQGGLAGQLGMLRMQLGDRVLDADDDVAQLILRRRYGMGRHEAKASLRLLQHQGTIANQELNDRMESGRSQEMATDIAQNRSWEAFKRRVGHSIAEGSGMNDLTGAGGRFITNIQKRVDEFTDSLFGVVRNRIDSTMRKSLDRIASGAASTGDIQLMRGFDYLNSLNNTVEGNVNPFAGGLLQGESAGRYLSRHGQGGGFAGLATRNMSKAELLERATNLSTAYAGGAATPAIQGKLDALNADEDSRRTARMQIERARRKSRETFGDESRWAQFIGGDDALAIIAFARINDIALDEEGGFNVRSDMLRGTYSSATREMHESALDEFRGSGRLWGTKFSRDEVSSVISNEKMNATLLKLAGAKGEEAQQLADQLLEQAQSMEGESGEIARSIAVRAQQDVARRGEVGLSVRRLAASERNVLAGGQVYTERMTRLSKLARVDSRYGDIVHSLRRGEGAGGYDLEEATRREDMLMENAVNMSEKGFKFRAEKLSELGDVGIRQLLAETRQRNLEEQFGGQARRGQRGARDAYLANFTGGMVSDMSFTVKRGGRERSVRGGSGWGRELLMKAFQSGDENIIDQFESQLRERGVSQSAIDKITGRLKEVSADGKFTEDEAAESRNVLQQVEEEVNKAALDQARKQASARDPMTAERNALLQKIANNTQALSQGGGKDGEVGEE